MDPLISPHDTAFIEQDAMRHAQLVVVDGSAREYLRRRQSIEQRRERLPSVDAAKILTWFGGGVLMGGVVLWSVQVITTSGLPLPDVLTWCLMGLGFLLMGAAVVMTAYAMGRESSLDAMLETLDAQCHKESVVLRPNGRAGSVWSFGTLVLEDVLGAITEERRDAFQRLFAAGEATAVEVGATMLLEQSKERRHAEAAERDAVTQAHAVRMATRVLFPGRRHARR